MKGLSTFAGFGGSSTGYKRAGFKMLAAVEWEKYAADCYKLNHPTTNVYCEDISKINILKLQEDLNIDEGELDLLDGSPPCQGFSTAKGKRDINDERNLLFWSHLKLIKHFKPKSIVVENVKGLITGEMKSIAKDIYNELENAGYNVNVGLIRGTQFGVPQNRPRVFFVGLRKDFNKKYSFPTHKIKPVLPGVLLKNVQPKTLMNINTGTKMYELMIKTKPGNSFKTVSEKLFNKNSYFNVFKISPIKICPTFVKSAPAFHWENRYVSIEEALVLTGFSQHYKFASKSYIKNWERIGNCVIPNVSHAIGEGIIKQLGLK